MDVNKTDVNKKVLQSQATRAELIRVASDLFSERGYAGAALDDIARKAGLTKGAVYHHFGDKRELFAAVVPKVFEEELWRIQAESKQLAHEAGETSWKRLLAMTELFLDSFLDPRQRRIVWDDGPSVLGWERWHELVSAPLLDRIGGILEVMEERGVTDTSLRGPLAQLVFGSVQEAGMAIAHAPDPAAKRAELAPALRWMLESLFRERRRGRSAG